MEISIIVLPSGECVLVDVADYVLVAQYKWFASKSGRRNVYAVTMLKTANGKVSHSMHRLIMKPSSDMVVDHINGCGLDNRRCNLRIVTAAENSRNKKVKQGLGGKAGAVPVEYDLCQPSGYFGVSVDAHGRGYRAYISTGGRERPRQHHLGYYEKPEVAAHIRDRAALYFHGENAVLNFPNDKSEAASPVKLRREHRDPGVPIYKGIRRNGRGWCAVLHKNYEHHYLGQFHSEREAALAYDSAALFFGAERSELNFPDEPTQPRPPHLLVPALKGRGECGYIGVRKKRNRFTATIMVNRKLHRLGVFDTAKEAAMAYDKAAFGFGETRNLNFPTVAVVEDRIARAMAGEDVGKPSGITYGEVFGQ